MELEEKLKAAKVPMIVVNVNEKVSQALMNF